MKKEKKNERRIYIRLALRSILWFCAGASLGLFFFISFTFIFFENFYGNKVYPGVIINNVDLGGKTPEQIITYFNTKNTTIQNTTFTFKKDTQAATLSAKQLQLGYDSNLIANQAYSIGRSPSMLANVSLIFQSYIYGVHLKPSYRYDTNAITTALTPIIQATTIEPVNALITFQNNRVVAFHTSSNGQSVDINAINSFIANQVASITQKGTPQTFITNIPIKIIKPKITTDDVNHLGINELIGIGSSTFHNSIASRVYNISLASTRINGVLVSPDEEFSFDQALGDVSSFTGYKQAYVIQNGHTVLGDGGGVCQVSTTFFRALLNAGLPITERHGHAYRVGYYEQDSPPGIDATIYVPTVDLKFKNNTGHYILIQTAVDTTNDTLLVELYGTKDGRSVILSKPVITNQTPPPAPLYQDDPTLPKGTIQQTDFAAAGADIAFTRQVIKNNKIIINETYTTNYQPWQAVYLRGTK